MEPGESFDNFNPPALPSFDLPNYINPEYLFDEGSSVATGIFNIIFNENTFKILHGLYFGFAIFFLTLMAYCLIRMFEIRAKEGAHLQRQIREYAHHQEEREKKKWGGEGAPRNARWTQVLEHLFSDNLNDWKLAIIESDTMLDELLTQLGFRGVSLGEKLKSADRDKFRNLTVAWEVHTLRNRIAHEGLSFTMSHYEAKRVIALYEQIFREFGYI